MLTRDENEALCLVGPKSLMGEFLREHWLPAVRTPMLQADGAPVRVRLLGENFVAFRATDGRVGFFDEGCPHRCTSLALARNEDNALTCIFHGWKIDVSGKVVEVPSEPPERRAEFAAKVRVRHYPVREAGGAVWVYLGRREQPPPFYNFEFNALDAAHSAPNRAVLHCNWLQGFEAVLDSAHVGFLHQASLRTDSADARLATVTSPVFELSLRPYGFREGALRNLRDGTIYARIREVVMPTFSFIPLSPEGRKLMICAIPIDDEWTAQWYFWYDPYNVLPDQVGSMGNTSGDPDNFCSDLGSFDNLFNQDRQKMREGHWSGLRCFDYEDFTCQVAMGPIVDRSREYLGSSDGIVIKVRRWLLQAARDFQRTGKVGFGQEQGLDYSRIRALAIRYRAEIDWQTLDSFNPPQPIVDSLKREFI
jgi:phthalate 4,5-dioxygenase oxygenase subunit